MVELPVYYGGDTVSNVNLNQTVSTTTNFCSPCGQWYWGFHYCQPTYHVHYCGAEGHSFRQADKPHDDMLFCPHCGEVKPLKTKGK